MLGIVVSLTPTLGKLKQECIVANSKLVFASQLAWAN